MDNWPRLAVLLLSYNRPQEAMRTIRGIARNLRYSGKIGWYVADDGSAAKTYDAILGCLRDEQQKVIGSHLERYSPQTGTGWNQGLGICYQYSDYVLVMEDDWELSGNYDMNAENHPGAFNINPYAENGKLNIEPYIEMLSEREDVGMVRLGGLAVGNTVEIVGHGGHHYLRYLKERQYAFSGNPHIRHARFVRAYGWYSNLRMNPGELELDYDARFRTMPGPDIWRPSDIPGWGIFHHIGQTRYR